MSAESTARREPPKRTPAVAPSRAPRLVRPASPAARPASPAAAPAVRAPAARGPRVVRPASPVARPPSFVSAQPDRESAAARPQSASPAASPARVPADRALVRVSGLSAAAEIDFDGPAGTQLRSALAGVHVESAGDAANGLANDAAAKTLLATRGYSRDELFAIAEIAYHYLQNGGLLLASTIFQGLAAIAPTEAYFALATGACFDRMDERAEAERWYTRAAELDRSDARPDVNLAELALDTGDAPRARALLTRAAAKARSSNDAALEKKASAMLRALSVRAPGGAR